MTTRGPPDGFTGERFGHRTRVVGGEGLPGAGGEVDVVEADEALGREGVSVLEVILEEDPSHSPPLPGRAHCAPVYVKSQTLLRGGHLLLLLLLLLCLLLLLGAGHFESIRSLRADED